jgi:uncharacterized protein YndB with AHSA1/START domain
MTVVAIHTGGGVDESAREPRHRTHQKGQPMSTPHTDQGDYTRELPVDAGRAKVYEALTTLEGLAGWWTPIVHGSPTSGGAITFGFGGLDETIVMRVDDATFPASVTWTCLAHTGHPEWEGTTLTFELHERGPNICLLNFRQQGLVPELDCYLACKHGWEHFLASLAKYAVHGQGSPV